MSERKIKNREQFARYFDVKIYVGIQSLTLHRLAINIYTYGLTIRDLTIYPICLLGVTRIQKRMDPFRSFSDLYYYLSSLVHASHIREYAKMICENVKETGAVVYSDIRAQSLTLFVDYRSLTQTGDLVEDISREIQVDRYVVDRFTLSVLSERSMATLPTGIIKLMSKFVRANWELVIFFSIQYLAQTHARRVLVKSEPFGRSPWSCFSRILHFFANHAFAKRYVSIYIPL